MTEVGRSRSKQTTIARCFEPSIPRNRWIEDAYEQALCFSQASSIQEALATKEQRRIPRTQLIQTRSALGEMRYGSNRQGGCRATNAGAITDE